MIKGEIEIPRVWHSQLGQIMSFLGLCLLCVFISKTFPISVLNGKILDIGPYSISLALPLAIFMPLIALFRLIMNIYDVRYVVDGRGLGAKIGVISLNQRIIRIRYEDIRSIEVSQTVFERILDVGRVDISTAASTEVELYFSDISAPREVQDWLQLESDFRQKRIHIKDTNKVISDVNTD